MLLKTHSKPIVILFFIVFGLSITACQSAAATTEQSPVNQSEVADIQPSVLVKDQELLDEKIVVAEANSDGPGWLVIHAQADGKPGPILGYSALSGGTHKDISIEINSDGVTDKLYAMLHTDGGEIGVFEFPGGPDVPVTVNDQVVTPAFKLLKAETPSNLLLLSENEELGTFLTGPQGMTLYRFTNDNPGESSCYDQCAENWPPLLLESGQELTADENISGEVGTTTRQDGTTQVTFNGIPLYYWVKDEKPGDTTGQGVNDVWFIVSPSKEILSKEIASKEILFRIVPQESKVTYEVGETFLNDNNRFNVAIGQTGQIEGEIKVDPENPQASTISPISVDISQFTSDSNRRDTAIRERFLESNKFPTATFVPTKIDGLPTTYNPGETITFTVTGDLTIREITQSVTFEVTMEGSEAGLTGEAKTSILMSDFGVGPISVAGILNTEDQVLITLNLVARP
jgi:predicted lipoprotein with Yx(FWY)xxD motif/polyisoprenoid-binding protein YceI